MGWGIPLAMVASAAIPSLLSKKNKSQTVTQQPLYTPEQEEALKRMLGFAKTGTYGGYTAGEGYSGAMGNYDMSALEKGSQSALANLMGQMIGTQDFGTGQGATALTNLLEGDKYDPFNEKGVYAGYKKQALREGQEAQDRLKQNLAITGDLYSTTNAKESGLLQERTTDLLNNKLAELYQYYGDQQVGAIPWALQNDQSAQAMKLQEKQVNENIAQNRISAGMQYGALDRMLKDQQARDQYTEWKRSREESKEPLKALESLYGSNVNWGAKSMTAPGYTSESPWASVLNNALDLGLRYMNYNTGSSGTAGVNGRLTR